MKRCYISAHFKTNLVTLKDILFKKNIEPVLPFEFPSAGFTIFEKIKELIAKADIFIAVFNSDLPNENLYFELGYATALGKQIILISDHNYKIPSNLKSLLIIKSGTQDKEALEFAINQVLSAPKPIKKKKSKIYDKYNFNKSDYYLNQIKTIKTDYELFKIVQNLLKDLGIDAMAESKVKDFGVDFAIWENDLEPIIGNPLIIELKREINKSNINRINDQIDNYLKKINSGSALVLYLLGPPLETNFYFINSGYVFLLKIETLLKNLKNQSFADILRSIRNKAVHGGIL